MVSVPDGLLSSLVFIDGTPKQVPITNVAPSIPEINGTNTVFPNPGPEDFILLFLKFSFALSLCK